MTTTTSHVKKRTINRTIIALVAILTLAGAGVAYAYWTSTGTGTGTATTGESTPFTITSAAAVGTIEPGGAGQTIAFTVDNPADVPQYLTEVTVTLADEDGNAWNPTGTCEAEDYDATITTAPTAGEIAASGTAAGVVTVTLANTTENQDDCQGQTVPLYFTAN